MSLLTLVAGLFKKPIERAAESALKEKLNELATINPEAHAALVHAWRAAKPALEKLTEGTATELDDLAVEVLNIGIEGSAAENGMEPPVQLDETDPDQPPPPGGPGGH